MHNKTHNKNTRQFLHAAGIVHCDLKPENILLDSDGHIRLTDYGLAKDFGSGSGSSSGISGGTTRSVVGTDEYLAPEMILCSRLLLPTAATPSATTRDSPKSAGAAAGATGVPEGSAEGSVLSPEKEPEVCERRLYGCV